MVGVNMKDARIIFVTGGVLSSLGKGIIAASTARLLKDQGLKVNMMKCDPYLNVDPGTMSPIEHGEVFVTHDGGETDLDIGHYERFLGQNLKSTSSLTSGRVYSEVLARERSGEYLGKTVQVVPHITNHIKEKIIANAEGFDVLFVEIGGTVGDIESLPYLEAIRQMQIENNTFLIHGAYLPYLKTSNELKTKPVQHSVKELQGLGIKPDMIVTRNEISITEKEREKISMFCNVPFSHVIESVDLKSVYEVPLKMKEQNVDSIIAEHFGLELNNSEHSKIKTVVEKLYHSHGCVKIGVVGKYTATEDSYMSIIESLKHAGIANDIKVEIELIAAQTVSNEDLEQLDGVIVPGGFGNSGTEGKVNTIKYCRENNIPMLGICLGMQLSVIEFANNVCNLNVEHGELNPDAKNKIIDIMHNQDLEKLGGTMRLGDYKCQITEGSLAHQIYGSTEIVERHRHRYEFNNEYRDILEQNGMKITGVNLEDKLVEIVEIPENDFFIAVQYHPELTSKLTDPNPLFVNLIKKCIK
jgi:CTP synthase